jgi:pimeloyl-ACP methyl ester carboxylesterase
MYSILAALCLAATPAPMIETEFAQVAPEFHDGKDAVRTAGEVRAIVLIHGLLPHPFNKELVSHAELHSWQKPGSYLVKRLRWEGDVYAFAYSQTVPADEITSRSDLETQVRRLRKMGYREVIVVGHSAGGVISRYLAEDYPDAGLTKVIQVCAPNAGSGWAEVQAVQSTQVEFLHSLTKAARRRALDRRKDRMIPDKIEFVCVVGTGTLGGDGLVSCRCAWPEDLQAQHIPAFPLSTTHWSAVRGEKGADLVAHLVRERQRRWDDAQTAATRKKLFGD